MTARELPAMQSSAYASQGYATTDLLANHMLQGLVQPTSDAGLQDWRAAIGHAAQPLTPDRLPPLTRPTQYIVPTIEKEPVAMARRLVQVFIADTNDSVPLDAALLYRGEPIFTDLADNELFFDLDIKGILAEHNKTRIGTPDKAAKDGAMLPPARVRDLKMNVVTIASF